MSLTKENPAFDRMMEEAREEEQNSYELYREWAEMKAKEETINPAQATTKEGQ